ncbi:50S ribosomal protein L19 [Prevotella histicola]
MTRINLKRVLFWLSLVLLSTLTAHSQTLCVIDGTPIPDSLLHVTIDEMRTDSAKQIVAKRLGFIPSQAIESIQIFSAEEQIEQGKYIIFCKTPKDIIFIRTNSLAELQWVINGKLRKPRKKLTIIRLQTLTPTYNGGFAKGYQTHRHPHCLHPYLYKRSTTGKTSNHSD